MHPIKLIALVVVAVMLLSTVGATASPARTVITSTKALAATAMGSTATKLTLTASKTTVAVGEVYTLFGDLKTADGKEGLSGKLITLQRWQKSTTSTGGTWTDVATTTTTGGHYEFKRSESAPGIYIYRTVFAGDATYASARSNEVTILVGGLAGTCQETSLMLDVKPDGSMFGGAGLTMTITATLTDKSMKGLPEQTVYLYLEQPIWGWYNYTCCRELEAQPFKECVGWPAPSLRCAPGEYSHEHPTDMSWRIVDTKLTNNDGRAVFEYVTPHEGVFRFRAVFFRSEPYCSADTLSNWKSVLLEQAFFNDLTVNGEAEKIPIVVNGGKVTIEGHTTNFEGKLLAHVKLTLWYTPVYPAPPCKWVLVGSTKTDASGYFKFTTTAFHDPCFPGENYWGIFATADENYSCSDSGCEVFLRCPH
jgi:hypothetical protein